MASNKRINFDRETMFYGTHGSVYQTGLEVQLRGPRDGKPDMMASEPTVMLIPVDRKSKPWHDRGMRVPVESLDELIQALEVIREEVEKRGGPEVAV